ncbi:MAG: RNA polymerase sigma factor [Phycisphaeraceae bacterium]|nr:RNA polymerase sigma factor [Phycisphaeraceae bacterium]
MPSTIEICLVNKNASTEPRSVLGRLVASGDACVPMDVSSLVNILRAKARMLGAESHEAEDLAQETIARILSRAPEKQGHVGYATQTLTRLWLDRQRTLRARARRLRRVAASTIVGSGLIPVTDDARSVIVFNAIRSLPPRQRAVLVLRLVEGLGYASIAEAIGCTEQAARASLHEARVRLRRELTQRGIEP